MLYQTSWPISFCLFRAMTGRVLNVIFIVAVFGASPLRVGSCFASKVRKAEEYTVNSTKAYFHKNTGGKREETVSPKPWCARRDVCDIEGESTEHAATRAT